MVRKVALWAVAIVCVIVAIPILFSIYEYKKFPILADVFHAATGKHPPGYALCLSKMDAIATEDVAADVENGCLMAAEAGDPLAQFLMGTIEKRHARNDPQKFQEAVKWYELSAKQDVVLSMNALGMMYFKGDGVAVDYEKARDLFMSAAKHKYLGAQLMLSNIYAQGRGVPQDNVQALEWLVIASKNPDANDKTKQSIQAFIDKFVAVMTPEQQAQANEMASKF